MGKINEAVSNLFDNDNSFCKAYDQMNKELKKLNNITEDFIDMDILMDAYESSEESKSMYIDRVTHIDKETGEEERYIRLVYQDDDSYSVQCVQQIFDIENRGMMLGLGFIQQIQQLAYMGYILRQSKTWEEKEVKELFMVD